MPDRVFEVVNDVDLIIHAADLSPNHIVVVRVLGQTAGRRPAVRTSLQWRDTNIAEARIRRMIRDFDGPVVH